ncbi:MAG: tRNA pseudouridine(55) synthase TruB [Alistipes sp.]|nr:tRNA pseudouridine(55) synthase TruB [Alistipes sp.]
MKPILSPDLPFAEGVVLPIDKPRGWTSSDAVRKLKVSLRRLGHRKIKIGHAGTLDPLATGILLICIGRATKQAEALQAEPKSYRATITLGATTPSYDLEHPIDQTYPYEHITREAVEDALAQMVGEQLQLPPVYSAKQIDGKRAYEYAREGEEVKMRHALITIYDIELESFALPQVTLQIRCSKGTYIRSIARDLGEKLQSGGYLSALCRTSSGNFTLADAYSIEEATQALSRPEATPTAESETPLTDSGNDTESNSGELSSVE